MEHIPQLQTILNDLKDTLKAFGDFKNKQQKCMKGCFLMGKSMYIIKCIYNVHYPPFCLRGEGLNLQPNFQKGGA